MFVVVVGCGRVGASIAQSLIEDGHDVNVIDQNLEALGRLGHDFPGNLIQGPALETTVLERAEIDRADAFVAATNGDNTNIVIAQVAQKKYGIRCVVARVYDPLRAELFQQAGIRTVCPTRDVRIALFDAVRACQLPVAEG